MAQRTQYIDIAKGIAILLVVYGHAATQMTGTPFFEESLKDQCTIIFSFVMPVFFMIAGSFQRKRLESPDFDHKAYLSKISLSLLLPFYSLSLLFLIPKALLRSQVDAPSLRDMVISILFQQSYLLPSGVLWFLFTLFAFALISYLFIKVAKMNLLILIAVAVLLRSDLNIYMHSYYFTFDNISKFLIFYVLGYGLRDIISKEPIHELKYLSIMLVVFLFLIFIAPNVLQRSRMASTLFNVVSWFGLSGLLGSLFVLGLSFNISQQTSHNALVKWLTYCGANSILIYVFHMPTFAIFNKIAAALKIESGYAKQSILFFSGILVPLVIGEIISRNEIAYKVLLGRSPRPAVNGPLISLPQIK